MFSKQLTMFRRQNCNGIPCDSWTVASWHWRWSLTWRWIVTYSNKVCGKYGAYFFRVYRCSKGFNFHCGINLPIVGSLNIQTQPNMRMLREAGSDV